MTSLLEGKEDKVPLILLTSSVQCRGQDRHGTSGRPRGPPWRLGHQALLLKIKAWETFQNKNKILFKDGKVAQT